jgi:hypothetical protein
MKNLVAKIYVTIGRIEPPLRRDSNPSAADLSCLKKTHPARHTVFKVHAFAYTTKESKGAVRSFDPNSFKISMD